jgi:hypothetical protein
VPAPFCTPSTCGVLMSPHIGAVDDVHAPIYATCTVGLTLQHR